MSLKNRTGRTAVPETTGPVELAMPTEARILAILAVFVALGLGIIAPAIRLLAKEFGVGHALEGLAISAFALAQASDDTRHQRRNAAMRSLESRCSVQRPQVPLENRHPVHTHAFIRLGPPVELIEGTNRS